MQTTLSEFKKSKKYLLCVDSDGCAMDTMNIKHKRCFGPCFADEWNITENRDAVLKRWDEINLYEITRGINRFKGLAHILKELYPEDEAVNEYYEWAEHAKELSEAAITNVSKENDNVVFKKALRWSKAVNASINALSAAEKVAFSGAKEALIEARKNFDIAIVSSANFAAVTEEWERCGLLQYTDVVTTQTDGNKAHCISELLKKGYEKENVIMCGDAEGDLLAAEGNGVMFYPILVNKETQSWERLQEFLDKFLKGDAKPDEIALRKAFYINLNTKEA